MPEKFTITGWIKKSLKEGFPNTVRENRWILIGVVTIFLVSIGVALVALSIGDNPVARFIQEHFSVFMPFEYPERSYLRWVGHILSINLSITLLTISIGVLFGMISLFPILMTGFSIGNMMSYGFLPPFITLSLMLPHGVFEISGLILAATCGMRLGIGSIKSVLKRKFGPIRRNWENALHLVLPAFLLQIIAGLTEGLLIVFRDLILSSILMQVFLVGVSFASFAGILLWMGGRIT